MAAQVLSAFAPFPLFGERAHDPSLSVEQGLSLVREVLDEIPREEAGPGDFYAYGPCSLLPRLRLWLVTSIEPRRVIYTLRKVIEAPISDSEFENDVLTAFRYRGLVL